MDWQEYEREKAKIQGLTPKEYEKEIRALLERMESTDETEEREKYETDIIQH